MTRARYVIDCVRVRMMIAMIRDPGAGRARSVETRKENQNLLDRRMELYRAMRETAMITDCGTQTTRARHK